MRREAQAATKQSKRLLIFSTMGTYPPLWTPTVSGETITAWSAMTQPLSAVASNVVLVEGMPSGNPNDDHGSSDSLTGQGFGYYAVNNVPVIKTSVDQFVAKQAGRRGDQPPDRLAAARRQRQRERRPLPVLRRLQRREPPDDQLAAVGLQHRVRHGAADRDVGLDAAHAPA